MGMLTRYRKEGGFQQLLMLIEQCNKKKQAQLLALVENEDLVWAEKIRAKMLTIERVLAFPQEGLSEIFSRIPEKVLVFALHGIPQDQHEKVLGTFSHFKKKALADLMGGAKPKISEVEAAYLAILKKVRDLDKDRTISIHRLSPELSLQEKLAS